MIKGEVFLVGIVLMLAGMQMQAAPKCNLNGSYGYVYDGVSYGDGGSAVEIAETGTFAVGSKACGPDEICGKAKATFRFPSFTIGQYNGPLWALIQLDFNGASGSISVDPVDPCQGSVDFLATGTVIKSTPVDLAGVTLFVDQVRSIAYTVGGSEGEIVDLISTSPGSVLAGTAKAR
jgi:hypothetical protein